MRHLHDSPRLLLITDAWHPQVNGVVRTLNEVQRQLESQGMEVSVVSPNEEKYLTLPCPTYPEILLSFDLKMRIKQKIQEFKPNFIHIATEGPLGLAARWTCNSLQLPFTTSLHTHFPDYIQSRFGMAHAATYRYMRWFHSAAERTLVTNSSMLNELSQRGFQRLKVWSRGVDPEEFRPYPRTERERPRLLYVGRIAIEKNIEAFLDLQLEGEKIVVGGGPQLDFLKRKYPEVQFRGPLYKDALAREYSAADVFVFPSRTDTFGLVMLEALACGVPVAAFPVLCTEALLNGSGVGALSEDLNEAVKKALEIPRFRCRQFALGFSWKKTASIFLENLCSIPISKFSAKKNQRMTGRETWPASLFSFLG